MRSKWSRAALPLSMSLVLLTAGCFRPAGEAIAPTVTGQAQIAVTRPMLDDSAAIPPAESTAVTDLVSEPQTAVAPTPIEMALATAAPSATPAPTVALVILTSTPQYITPELPLGFTTPDTPAPTVAPVLDTVALTSTPGQLSFIIPDSSNLQATPTNLPGVDDPCIYIIQSGDTLYGIALNNGFSVAEIVAANPDLGGSSAVIQPGDPLLLPLPECLDAEATLEPGVTAPAIRATAPPAPAPTATSARPDGSQVYVVQPGDVLVNIAARFGVTASAIARASNLTNVNALQVGQELIIPPASP